MRIDIAVSSRTFIVLAAVMLAACGDMDPMDLQWPPSGSKYSVATDDLTLAWTDAGTLDDMWIRVDADCLEPNTADDWWLDESFDADVLGDPGVASIDLGDELMFEDHCAHYAATVSLVRARADVRQVRSVAVTLTP